MATIAFWTPFSAEFPDDPPPFLSVDGEGRPFLGFNDTTDESCIFSFVAPSDIDVGGNQEVRVYYRCDTATTGNVAFEVAVEAISDGDSLDTDSASSFATAISSGSTAVPGTAGFMDVATVTLSVAQADNIAAGDMVRVRLINDAGIASGITGDVEVLFIEWRDNG